MNRSTFSQVKILFLKNWTIISKQRTYLKEQIFPLLTFIILLVASKMWDPYSAFSQLAIVFVPMVLVSVTRVVVFTMIDEKMSKQKELQKVNLTNSSVFKIMGVKQSSYVIGWLLTNLSKFLLVFRNIHSIYFFQALSLSFDVFNVYSFITPPSKMVQVSSFLLFGLAQMSMSYLISVFFNVAKTGGDVSIFLSVLGSFLSQLLQIHWVQEQFISIKQEFSSRNSWVIYLLCLFPSTSYMTIIGGSTYDIRGLNFNSNDAMLMMGVDIVLYFVLYIYLDQVLPNEYGTHKSPLFFLKMNRQQVSDIPDSLSLPLYNQSHPSSDAYADVSSAVYHEPYNQSNEFKVQQFEKHLFYSQKTIEIFNLRKSFGNTQAVNGITLNVYESQLLCILGHNGAGKTTTISLVTGLVEKDAGLVKFYGQSIDSNLDDIRQMTGICVQRDVLYDELTVEQHLIYYAQMKGYEGQALQTELEYTIQKCVLTTERNKLAKQLSGGNKRKLSLGMALIGKSKVVFLDEPTSGMDPVTRRAIWDILQEVKRENRTLILTTHHLDEAEELSERIAIMAKGKLLTVGSSNFIKKNFGIGYHLSIYRSKEVQYTPQSWENKKEQVKNIVKQTISASQYNPQSAEDVILFTIPYEQKKDLLPLFEKLEHDTGVQIALQMNSLEEAFINIGMDEEKFINKTRRYSTQKGNIQVENQEKQADFTDFSQIPAPPCLSKSPSYSFMLQFKACLLRKIYCTKFGKRFVMQIIVPIYFVIITVFICVITKNHQHAEPQELIAIYAFMITFEMSLGMAISAGSIAGQPVEEREQKLKYHLKKKNILLIRYALNVMGCRVYPYWVGTMFYDTIVAEIMILILIAALGFSGIGDMIVPGKSLVLVFTQFAFVGLGYTVSWMYTSSKAAYKTAFLVIYGLFFLVPLILMMIFKNRAVWILTAFISPILCMLQGLFVDSQMEEFSLSSYYFPYWIILVVQGLAGFFLCVYIDTRSLSTPENQQIQLVQSHELDVLDEAQRVANPSCNDSVKATNISKVYANGFSAVKGTSFGIERKQVFGLLGPNGAGKSTTFNILTSRLKPTTGNIYLLNQRAEKGNAELYQNVGICPQFDCLWETMTPIEHLKIFALIKGLQGEEVDQAVNYFIRIMQLDAFVKTQGGKLSGGNKRKLCVSMALIGGPNMQFFDEPSSGVDPIARRFLWNTIQQGLKLNDSAVILTTHSMDEAESLCHKIGIQINGQFVCMGSPQHLKAKYGNGYSISIDMIGNQVNSLKKKQKCFQQQIISNFVKNRFPLAQELEPKANSTQLTFQFPNREFSFFKVFDFFQNDLQQKGLISDFQITQASLEQVFIKHKLLQVFMHFASFQENRENEVFVPKSRPFYAICNNDEDD